jgi:hypothetical protein
MNVLASNLEYAKKKLRNPAICIYDFRVILSVKSEFFFKQH